MSTIDVAAVRAQFPALAAGAAHFDGPGGSQTPSTVARAVHDTLVSPMANRGDVTPAEHRVETVVAGARRAMADLVGRDPRGIVFGRSMTQLTFDMSRTLSRTWHPGDEVVVSRLDHDANVRPWVIAAERTGATVRWIDFDVETTEVTVEHVAEVVGERTRLVALTGASNLLGTRPHLPRIADLVHGVGALFYVDGVHLTPHASVDAVVLGADFYVCSPYKFFGPHCGVLAAAPELLESLHPDKLLPSSDDVPERYELGTLPFELMAGTTAAVDFIANLVDTRGSRREQLSASMSAADAHETALLREIEAAVAGLSGVAVRSRASGRTPTLLLTFADHSPRAACEFLATLGVNTPAGTFYAFEAARRLELRDGGLRIGLAVYNDSNDVDRLVDGLTKLVG